MTVLRTFKSKVRQATLPELCSMASTLEDDSDRTSKEVLLVEKAVEISGIFKDIEHFIDSSNLRSTRNLAIRKYTETKGIQNFAEFRKLLGKTQGGFGAREAITVLKEKVLELFEAGKDGSLSLKDIPEMSEIVYNLSEEEQKVAENNLVGAAIIQLETAEDVVNFLKKVSKVPFHNAILSAYAVSGKMQSVEEGAIILSAVFSKGDSEEPTRVAIQNEIVPLFNAQNEIPLETLSNLAENITDGTGDGSDSAAIENMIIAAALKKLNAPITVAMMSERFSLKTGSNKLIAAYVKERGVPSKDEAEMLFRSTRGSSDKFCAGEARTAIIEAAKASSLNIEAGKLFEEIRNKERDLAKNQVAGAIGSILGSPASLVKAIMEMGSDMQTDSDSSDKPEELDAQMKKHLERGTLAEVKISVSGGRPCTLSEFLNKFRDKINPGHIPIFEKYAQAQDEAILASVKPAGSA